MSGVRPSTRTEAKRAGGTNTSFAGGSRITKRMLIFANRVYIPKNVLRITAR